MNGSVRRDPNGRTWGYVFDAPRVPGGKRRQIKRRGFGTQREAAQALRTHQADVDADPTARGTETLVSFLHKYVDGLDGRAPSTLLSYQALISVHVASHPVGAKPIGDITPVDIEALLDAARKRTGRSGKPLSSKTMRNLFNFLRSAFAHAMATLRIRTSPMDRLKAPAVRRDPDRMQCWTPDEARAFLAFLANLDHPLDQMLGAIVMLALLTGMRRGELLGLRWSDIDLEQRTLSVRRTRIGVGSHVVEGPPKTAHGHRTLALAPEHLEALLAVQERQATYRNLFGAAWVDSGLVFTDEHGAGLLPDAVSQRFRRLVLASGVRPIRFHDLRHTHASLAISGGEHIKAVSARLGHADIGFTLRQYTHLLPEHQGFPADAVVAALRSTDSTPHNPGVSND